MKYFIKAISGQIGRPAHRAIAVISFFINISMVASQQIGALGENIISEEPSSNLDFPIVSTSGQASSFECAKDDFKGVLRAVKDFQTDINKVTGVEPGFHFDQGKEGNSIQIGTHRNSEAIDKLVASGKLEVKNLKGKWERFIITTRAVDEQKNLIIAGSDQRGPSMECMNYQGMGVSPRSWWADVPTEKMAVAYVKAGNCQSEEPKVKYRGIFGNDEEPAA